jgi:hypothetical protein
MSAIDRLQKVLAEALAISFESPPVPKTLDDQLHALRQTLSGAGAQRPSRDRVHEAIARFRQTQKLIRPADARLVCYGCAERFSAGEPPLIEDPAAIATLLQSVDQYAREPRSFRRCYRGLLHVYFTYDGEGDATGDAGRDSWRALRTYLSVRRSAIRVGGLQPEWVETIESNPDLLTADPVGRYTARLLDGDTAEVDQIKLRLDIQDTSWLMRRLIIAQIVAATRASDEDFMRRAGRLLGLLEGHPLLETEALVLIIERYASICSPVPHPGLRERAIRAWGNPMFRRHSAEWCRVSEPARAMIAQWVTLDIIEEFFQVLSEDRQTEQRRARFWQRYHERIDDVYVALGSAALYSKDRDAERVRMKMGDRVLALRRGGNPLNNALILLLPDIVAVEFGVRGEACYLYERNALPFALRGEVSGDPDGLKSVDHLQRLTHTDAGFETWEDKFHAALSERRSRHDSAARRNFTSFQFVPARTGRTDEPTDGAGTDQVPAKR